MKKTLLLLAFFALLTIAYYTKPDDKTCIEVAVKAVWGNKMPDQKKFPVYYAQFMDLNSSDVLIDDWIFMKRIRYRFPNKEYRIGFGAFKHIMTND